GTLNLQVSKVADRALDFLCDTLRGFVCVVVGWGVASFDVLSEVRDIRADFVIAARFDDEAIAGSGAEVNVADGDATAASFKNGKRWAAVGTWHLERCDFANGGRLADAFAADD